MRSTPPRASTFSSVMSKRRYLKLVLPRLATRIFISLRSCKWLFAKENVEYGFFGTRNDVGADEFAVLTGRRAAGIDGSPDGANVAADECRHERAADLHLAGHRHVGSLAHGVGGRDGRDQALGFHQAEGFVIGIIALVHEYSPEVRRDGLERSSCENVNSHLPVVAWYWARQSRCP